MAKPPKNRRNTACPSAVESVLPASSAWKLLAGGGLIALAALLVYLPSLQGGFLVDDDGLVIDSTLIKASDGLYRFWFTTEPADYWPLTNSSFWIEWRLWGMNPTGYHVTNLLLHVASALLIWPILNRLSIPGAWLAALLFAVHPVNVESVAWISQRKNTLSMLFFLLSILCYLKADGGAKHWYGLSLLAFTLAMLGKGSVAVLPPLLLLLAWWQRGKIDTLDLVRTGPFFIIAVVLTLVNIWFQTHGLNEEYRTATFMQRLLGAGAVVWFYLYKALVPLNLLFVYPQWNIQVSDWRWWTPLLAAVFVTAGLLCQRNSRYGRPLLFAWLFFCVALLPVMGFTDVGFMRFSLVADHYQYLAIIGVVALVAAGLAVLYRQAPGASARRGWAAVATAVIMVSLLTLLSWQQSRLYADPSTLYEATLLENPGSCLGHNSRGVTLHARGRNIEAIECFRMALRLYPDYAEAHHNLALELAATGQRQEAIEHFLQALRCRPQYAKAHFGLALELAASGNRLEAIEHYQQALDSNPHYAEVHNSLAIELASAGRLQEAMEHYHRALELKPDFVEAYNNLGLALFNCGQFDEATKNLKQAVRLNPHLSQIHLNLCNALAKTGQWSEAIEHFQQALQLQPDNAEAHDLLGLAYSNLGQSQQAIEHFQQALQLKPDYPGVHNNLGIELARLGRLQEAIDHYQQALRLRPNYPEAQNNLASALKPLGRLEEAIEHCQQALRLQPDYPEAYANLATIFAKMNRSEEALASAQKALDLARSSEQTALAQRIEAWLAAYRARLSSRDDTLPRAKPDPPP